MVRKGLGIAVGFLAAMIVIALVEAMGRQLFPAPAGIDLGDRAQVTDALARLPSGLKAAVVLAWFAGAAAGGWVGLALSRWRIAPWIVAAGVLLASVANFVMVPHPMWMQVAGLIAPLIAAWLVSRRSPR